MKDKFKIDKNKFLGLIKNQYFFYLIDIFIGFFLSIILSFTVSSINFLYGYLFSLSFILFSIFISSFYPKIILKSCNNRKRLKKNIILFYSVNISILVIILIITIFLKLYSINEIDIYGVLVGIIVYVIVSLTIKYFWYRQTIKEQYANV